MIELPQKDKLQKRIENEERKFIQIILGPRQVGKTTLVTQLASDSTIQSHYASADSVLMDQTTWISQQWEAARFKLKNSKENEFLLIIDEIQKIDQWSEIVKKEWDYDSINNINLKVILLGSSRVLIQSGLTESLAGRYETTHVGHWTYSLMKKSFNFSFDEFVWFGGYPGTASLVNNENRWKSYIRDSLIESSISKDILMTSRIDKPALLKRLFEIGCAYSSQILSYNKILGQLTDAGNTTTLAHYLTLLDSAGFLTGLEKFSPEITRQRASSPKFQVQNMALKSGLESSDFNEIRSNPIKWGRWVESCIGTHLLNHSFGSELNVFYWRHRNDEIDFVLEYKNKIIGIEVKSGSATTKRGISAFNNRYDPHKVLLVGYEGIPLDEFCSFSPYELF
ncbi:MAG: ATP-binding protein [bacterium]|nr:ATP-binding protein [bacterium]